MLWKLVASLAIIVGVASIVPGEAGAHAEFDRSFPEPDSIVDQLPAQIEIWFTEELADGSTATVTGPDGSRADSGDAEIDLFDPERNSLIVPLQPGLSAGEYTVRWTSVSGEDDDTDTGSFTFTISASATPVASPAASPSPVASPEPPEDAAVVTQTSSETNEPDTRAVLIALAVGLGAAALIYGFWLLVKPRPTANNVDGE